LIFEQSRAVFPFFAGFLFDSFLKFKATEPNRRFRFWRNYDDNLFKLDAKIILGCSNNPFSLKIFLWFGKIHKKSQYSNEAAKEQKRSLTFAGLKFKLYQ